MIYTNEELDYFKQALDKHPQQVGLAQADLEDFTGKRSSLGTLKRALNTEQLEPTAQSTWIYES